MCTCKTPMGGAKDRHQMPLARGPHKVEAKEFTPTKRWLPLKHPFGTREKAAREHITNQQGADPNLLTSTHHFYNLAQSIYVDRAWQNLITDDKSRRTPNVQVSCKFSVCINLRLHLGRRHIDR